MSMSDPIADMLTRIRNACGAKHRRVDMPLSKMKAEVARILKENNYIQDYSTLETDEGRQVLRVRLKYAGGQSVIRQLQRVSTPVSGNTSASARSRACAMDSAWRFSAPTRA
jgi:small subunit ribosomal protein S8